MKDARIAEIAWLVVLIVLVAAGGGALLRALAANRVAGSVMLALAVAATFVMLRRSYRPAEPTVRADVTRAGAYCCSAVLALLAVAARQHWAIGSCIIATEISLAFDAVTVAARPRAMGG